MHLVAVHLPNIDLILTHSGKMYHKDDQVLEQKFNYRKYVKPN